MEYRCQEGLDFTTDPFIPQQPNSFNQVPPEPSPQFWPQFSNHINPKPSAYGYALNTPSLCTPNNCPVTPPATPTRPGGWLDRPPGRPQGRPPEPPAATSASLLTRPLTYRVPARLARPAKMSAPPPKRPANFIGYGGSYAPKVKLPKLNRPTENFSNAVKHRLQTYSRTGQACDRCKIRKIRCDALPNGCSQCIQQNLECWVTDRVTGRTERRGYRAELELEVKVKEGTVKAIEAYLGSRGFEIRPFSIQQPPGTTLDDDGNLVQESGETWEKVDNVGWIMDRSERLSRVPAIPPVNVEYTLESRPVESHLGVGGDSQPSSSIRGTRLSILGATIDLNSFDAPDMDEPQPNSGASPPVYNKSFHAMCQSLFGISPRQEPELLTREEAFMYSSYYFQTVSNFLPILHQPSFMLILAKIYDQPDRIPDPNITVAEWAIFHMVMAIMLFQYSSRNFWPGNVERIKYNSLSNTHYHFALRSFQNLANNPDLAAVQAMALMASHARAFPKPESAAYIANLALKRALDLGLHRESRKPDERTNLRHELRKRIWWAILTVSVAVTGRRGEPMPLTVQDFDVGFPEPIADELLSEDGVDTSRPVACPYEVGIQGFKVIPLFIRMYSSIYAVRPDAEHYANTVHKLEQDIRLWELGLPHHLNTNYPKLAETNDGTHMRALYCRSFLLEFRLCLRHPSVALTTDKAMMADNLRNCETVAREFLQVQQKLKELKSLDTTWYQISVNIASIFTILAANWERRRETTEDDISSLRDEMEEWLQILENTGQLLGSGPRISDEIRNIIDRSIHEIERDMPRTDPVLPTTSVAPAIKVEPQPQPPPLQAPQEPTAAASGTTQSEEPPKAYYQDTNLNSQATYPQLAYGNQSQGNVATSTFDPEAALLSPYPTSLQATAALATADASSSQQNPLIPFASQAAQPVVTQPGTDMMWQQRGNSWTDWTSNVIESDQERFSATALMNLHQLGGAGSRDATAVPSSDATASASTNVMNGVPPGGQWPLMFYNDPGSAGTDQQ